jgi:hypothetical protein
LACGSELSDRLDKLVLASSMVPFELPGVARTFDPARRFGYWMIGNVPGQSRWVAWLQARAVRREPAALLERISSKMSQRDRDLLEGSDGFEPLMAHLVEAYRQGSAGVAHEMKLIARPWGIRIDAIGVAVDLFHGELDRNVPVGAARLLSDAIPHCRPTVFSGEGHLGSPGSLESIVAALAAD